MIRKKIHIDGAGWHSSNETCPCLPIVQEAVWRERKLSFVYKRDLEPTERTVHGTAGQSDFRGAVGSRALFGQKNVPGNMMKKTPVRSGTDGYCDVMRKKRSPATYLFAISRLRPATSVMAINTIAPAT